MVVRLRRVIIIGGGIGGLCTAIGLHRLGLDVSVYEQAPAFAEVGAGLTIWANAIKALRKLGISEDALGGARLRQGVLSSWNGKRLSTSSIEALEPALGAPGLAVHRADLHHALLSALPRDTVQVGYTCTGFEQDPDGVTVCFSDGSTQRADLLVGADGIHSVVRRQLFPGVTLRYAGYPAWRGVVTLERQSLAPGTSELWGRGARFGIVPIGNERVYWFATANLPAGLRPAPDERKAELLRRFSAWHAPIEELIKTTPPENILYNDIFDFPPIPRWSEGRVTLLGDAAHPTTPNMGQGAARPSRAVSRSLAAWPKKQICRRR